MEFKRKKKKKRTPVTLLVIPDIKTRPSLYNISRRVIVGIFGAAAVFVLAFVMLGYSHITDLSNISNLEDVKQESSAKDLTITQMRQEMDEIKKQQEKIDQKQKEIQKLMGVKSETSAQVPSRGGESVRTAEAAVSTETLNGIQTQDIMKKLSIQEKELDAFTVQIKEKQAALRYIPNQWPVRGQLTSFYGIRRSPFGGRTQAFHEGIDISNQVGAPIVAAADGQVIYAGWMSGYGNFLVINHGNGLETKYGHNSQLLVKIGSKVKKGDLIARMGSTGLSTGPHLHFEITKNGTNQNPLSYLH